MATMMEGREGRNWNAMLMAEAEYVPEPCPLASVESAMRSCRIGSDRHADLPDQCGVLRAVVRISAPHKIEQVSTDLLDLFQLSASQCIGRTMGVLSGPGTDTKTLMQLVEAARFGKEETAVLMLYSRSGAGDKFCVTAQPYFSNCGELTGCLLELAPCKAPNLKIAAQDDGKAKVIIEAQAPYRAIFCSPEFEALYGMTEPMVLGRTLNFIQGPHTDLRSWVRQVNSACRGTPSSFLHVTATSDCREIETMIDMQSIISDAGYITHIVVVSSPLVPLLNLKSTQAEHEYGLHQAPAQDYGEWDALSMHSKMRGVTCASAHDILTVHVPAVHGRPHHQSAPVMPKDLLNIQEDLDLRAVPAYDVEFESSYCMPRRGDLRLHTHPVDDSANRGTPPLTARPLGVSTVIPRRKAGQVSSNTSSPVSITLETLGLYANVPLSKAATLLGISSTAMKKACRKLGVTRWPYIVPTLAKSAPGKPNPSVTQVDSAYVRKLFRKYSGSLRVKEPKMPDGSQDSLRESAGGAAKGSGDGTRVVQQLQTIKEETLVNVERGASGDGSISVASEEQPSSSVPATPAGTPFSEKD